MRKNIPEAVLLCRSDNFSDKALTIVKKIWPVKCFGIRLRNPSRPAGFCDLIKGKALFSFRNHLILRDEDLSLLNFAINFHPAPPDLRGVGGYNFALYQNRKNYGVVAHVIEKEIDKGKIIAVKNFSICECESVASLEEKSYRSLLCLVEEVLLRLISQEHSPREVLSGLPPVIDWSGKLITRKALDDLCTVSLNSSSSEFQQRYQACHYPPNHGLRLKVGNSLFNLTSCKK